MISKRLSDGYKDAFRYCVCVYVLYMNIAINWVSAKWVGTHDGRDIAFGFILVFKQIFSPADVKRLIILYTYIIQYIKFI